MQNYRNLLVWKKSHAVAVGIHRLTQTWTRRDNPALVSQIRRAAQSVPANIAEGSARATDRDFAKFIQIAIGSTVELEYHLEFARDIEVVNDADWRLQSAAVIEVRRMLVGLLKKLRRTQ
jgi:four helix bundle protein